MGQTSELNTRTHFSSKKPAGLINASLLLLCLLCLVGCGRKVMPVPPGSIRPKPITDLHYTITASGAEFSWSVPIRHTDGSPVYKLEGFELYKAELPIKPDEQVCGSCPVHFGEPIFIPFETAPEVSRKMFYEDRTLQQGKLYVYEIRSKKGFLNTSDISNRVTFSWHSQPSAPTGTTLNLSKEGMELRWKRPQTWVDGSLLDMPVTFNIYKQAKNGTWVKIQKNIQHETFMDKSLLNNQENVYAISAELNYHGTVIEGEMTEKMAYYVSNIEPPKPPKGLVAKVAKNEKNLIEILWQESSEPDLGGYYVYRQTKEGGLIVRLNQQPLTVPRFHDTTILPDGIYTYWVTAIDATAPPNESRFSEKAEVEVIN